MMRSMFSGVSGLRVHQTRMDVIAHNVSNVNTVGFKSSRTLFDDMFSQTIQPASAPSPAVGRGGVNPMQIGLGANVASIDRLMTPGAAQRTDNAFDMLIEGPGFFIVGDANGTFFTRNGAMRLDVAGNLVNASGLHVLGWPREEDEENPGTYIIRRGEVEPIRLTAEMQFSPPNMTTQTRFEGNLDASPGSPDVVLATLPIRDSLGNSHILRIQFERQPTAAGATATTWIVTALQLPPSLGGEMPTGHVEIQFDRSGNFIGSAGPGIEIPTTIEGSAAELHSPIAIDWAMTQFGNTRTDILGLDVDGLSAGRLIDVSVGQDGVLMGRYDNGAMQVLWQIPVAEFQNPPGLDAVGGSLFASTANSGEFNGVGIDGIMRGGVLEMSNVDLSAEFTDMIITQRGFQSNSRVITTSDDMLQELVNLRRR